MTTQVFPLLNAIQPLTGAENYPQWRFTMEDILTLTEARSYRFNGMDIVNGRWNITAVLNVPVEGATLSQERLDENQEILKQREERDYLNKVVIAIINNRITPGLTTSRTDDPFILWHDLMDTYGTAGPSAIFTLYQQTLGFKISGNKEPSAEITQLELIYNRLMDVSVPIPRIVQAMTLLGSVPEHWKIASSFLAAKGSVTGVTFQNVQAAILQEYNQQLTSKSQASHFSGVKKGSPRPPWQQQGRPQYQGGQQQQQQPSGQQQQQPGNNNSQGPSKKNRRGKKKPQQGTAKTVALATNNDDYTSKDAGFVYLAKAGSKQVNTPATRSNAILAISHDPRPRPEN
jgi:hypothetical protein